MDGYKYKYALWKLSETTWNLFFEMLSQICKLNEIGVLWVHAKEKRKAINKNNETPSSFSLITPKLYA